jgi:hypothetical protein
MSEKKLIIGVISDTHLDGYDAFVHKRVATHFRDADMIFHAGDMVSPDVLKMFGEKEVRAVSGNMDGQAVREKFPERLFFEINGLRFMMVHGWGSPWGIEQRITAGVKEVDCVIYGHTHHPANHKRGNTYFFNPGSAVDRFFNSSKTVGILEIGKDIKGKIINL